MVVGDGLGRGVEGRLEDVVLRLDVRRDRGRRRGAGTDSCTSRSKIWLPAGDRQRGDDEGCGPATTAASMWAASILMGIDHGPPPRRGDVAAGDAAVGGVVDGCGVARAGVLGDIAGAWPSPPVRLPFGECEQRSLLWLRGGRSCRPSSWRKRWRGEVTSPLPRVLGLLERFGEPRHRRRNDHSKTASMRPRSWYKATSWCRRASLYCPRTSCSSQNRPLVRVKEKKDDGRSRRDLFIFLSGPSPCVKSRKMVSQVPYQIERAGHWRASWLDEAGGSHVQRCGGEEAKSRRFPASTGRRNALRRYLPTRCGLVRNKLRVLWHLRSRDP